MPICLYCRRENAKFTSVEHVIPEGLGNRGHNGHPKLVLPKGTVCDKCNNGKLSDLDKTLIEFVPVSILRTVQGVISKTGKLPSSKFNNANLTMVAPGNVLFESNSRKTFERTQEGFRLNVRGGRRMTPRYVRKLTQAVFEMTLGCMHIDHGPEVTLQERFDPVRRMILGLEDFHGYLMMPKKVQDPSAQESGLTYGFWEGVGERTVWALFTFYGFSMFTDLEIRRPMNPEVLPKDQVEIFYF